MTGVDLQDAPGEPTVWRRRRCRIKSCSYLSHATRKKRRGDDSNIEQPNKIPPKGELNASRQRPP